MNFFGTNSRYLKAYFGSFVLASLLISFLCISLLHTFSKMHFGMESEYMIHQSGDVTMHACCNSDVTDHIEFWKNIGMGIPPEIQQILILLAVVLIAVSFSDLFGIKRNYTDLLTLQLRYYTRDHPNWTLFDHLRLAFSRGILNPKLF